ARDLALGRVVALKMVLAGEHAAPEQVERFRAEARKLASLQHPNIVQVHEVGEHDGRPFFSLEYVEGGSLADKLAGRPQPACQAAALLGTLARAVASAHAHGIIHRDLKPANILLQRSEVRGQKAEVRGQRSEGRGEGVRAGAADLCPLTSD